jgi:N-acetylmuramoyl-L-alanine amidase
MASKLEAEFKTAWHDFHDLVKDERKAKYRAYWQDLEKQFLAIYKDKPDGPLAPKALFYAGRVNEELGRRSYLKSDFRRAVDYYQRVVSRFAQHSWADDCLYRKALIELNYLDEPDQATAGFKEILRDYPKGDMRDKARDILAELEGVSVLTAAGGAKAAEPESTPEPRQESKPRDPEPEPRPEPKKSRQAEAPASMQAPVQKAKGQTGEDVTAEGRRTGPIMLRNVRFQSSDDYTRIVINVDDKVPYRYQLLNPVPELDKPHRLYIDLEGTRLGPKIDSQVDIADGILRRVRLGQNTPTVTRVVLDFQDLQKYQIFALESPFRIIVDVSAPDKSVGTQLAEVRKPIDKQARPEEPAPAPQNKAEQVETDTEPVKRPVSKPVAKGDLKREPPAEQTQAKAERRPVQRFTPAEVEKAPRQDTPKDEKPEQELAAREDPPPPVVEYSPPPESHKQSATLVEQLGLTVRTIMIDPGHGGKDPGAIGSGKVYEKDINLRFALILGKMLEQEGFKVLYTREKDIFIPLEDRTAKANIKNVDLFISVHCNAIHLPSLSGLETYYLDLATSKDAVRVAARENAVSARSISDLQVILTDLMLNSKLKESKDLAKSVHSRVVNSVRQKHKVRDHGVRSAPFYVLMGAKMPAILVELGYLTNLEEAKRLQSDDYLKLLAAGVVTGVAAYKHNIERFASL